MAKILIVEDEIAINELVQRNLKLVGHECITVYDGQKAVDELEKQTFDLVLLDIMLPKLDGFEVFQHIKKIPTIFLTAKDGLNDCVKGLNMGAEDYITKPFKMLELIARVEVALRRNHNSKRVFEISNVKIDFDSRQIYYYNKAIECTPKEYALFEALVNNRNIALSRDKILDIVWGYDYVGDTRTVDVHIQKLRSKLGLEDYIKTVYKLGYRLEV